MIYLLVFIVAFILGLIAARVKQDPFYDIVDAFFLTRKENPYKEGQAEKEVWDEAVFSFYQKIKQCLY